MLFIDTSSSNKGNANNMYLKPPWLKTINQHKSLNTFKTTATHQKQSSTSKWHKAALACAFGCMVGTQIHKETRMCDLTVVKHPTRVGQWISGRIVKLTDWAQEVREVKISNYCVCCSIWGVNRSTKPPLTDVLLFYSCTPPSLLLRTRAACWWSM